MTQPHPDNIPFWAKEQLRLRETLDAWVTEEIEKYNAHGFQKLFGSKGGHAMDETGGYTRSFVGAYCLSGDERVPTFLKQFRDDWKIALNASGHFYHGYNSNKGGDYITHTAEAFTQFLLNVLYLDISDETTTRMVEDGAEHLGNWCPDVQDWYDWEQHIFLSYFLGTKSPYHKPPYNFQTPRHFRVLQIAVAAYEATGKERYLELCKDYCGFYGKGIIEASTDMDAPTHYYLISPEEFEGFSKEKPCSGDWRFTRYYEHFPAKSDSVETVSMPTGMKVIPYSRVKELKPPYHVLNDLIMTGLEIYKHAPEEEYKEVLRRLMSGWISLGEDEPSQVAGIEPHCGVHLPKYRDFTGDTSLDAMYLKQWPNGPCSYLLTGQEDRLVGSASMAEAVFSQALVRNSGRWGKQFSTDHACSRASNAGTSSADVAPALFMPAFGGLNVHYGRAPWVQVLYYTNGRVGLPADVAALYVPASDDGKKGVKLANTGSQTRKVAVRSVDPSKPENIVLITPAPQGLIEVTLEPGEVSELNIED